MLIGVAQWEVLFVGLSNSVFLVERGINHTIYTTGL
jgi:hypothetical protein